MINNKNEIYRQNICNGKLQHFYNSLASISNTLVETLKSAKGKYYSELSNRLNNHFTVAKTYWIMLKAIVN